MTTGADAARKRGLGRGLQALLGGDEPAMEPVGGQALGVQTAPIEFLHPSPFQPRRQFDEDELASLAASIAKNGLLQPILVRPARDGGAGYEIVAGERRWRAAQRAGLEQAPVVVRELEDVEALSLALIENVQRQDLSPLEEARAFRRLIDEFGHRQEDVAEAVGKSRSHIANTLRLLSLPAGVAQLLEDDQLSAGHARALIGAEDPERLAAIIVQRGLNVRQAEALVKAGPPKPAKASRREPDPDVAALEEEMASRIGLAVKVEPKGKGGRVVLRYSDAAQLEGLLDKLRQLAA